MSNDLTYITWWWLMFLLSGIVSVPLVWKLFKNFTDIGYGFAKTTGFLSLSLFIFYGAIAKILFINSSVIYLSFSVYIVINILIYKKYRSEITKSVNNKFRSIVASEIIFTLGLIFWSYIRAHQPDINGLEKFMDLGFINSILRSKYLPPTDMWFAGKPINYYWFGHFYVAIITKFTNIPSSVSYNLMLATILGQCLSAAFSITSTLVENLKIKINKRKIFLAGLISATLLVFGGNFHTPIYILKEKVSESLTGVGNSYWYPDATRFIGYNPDVDDKTIHEFPLYSFVVSDLHAHLINLPFVLMYLALLYSVVQKERIKFKNHIPLGFVFGAMFMTSAWDFANYGLTTGFVLLFTNLKKIGFKTKTFINSFSSSAIIAFLAVCVSIPFLLNFESLAKGVDFVHSRSRLWQLAILWGFPAILTISFCLLVAKKKIRIKVPDLFVAGLFVSSWTLIVIPEIIYVKDIYISSHHRANTMFKLTYQSFVMSYLSSGYVFVRLITAVKKRSKYLMLTSFGFIFALLLMYPRIAINSYYADLNYYKGLNGETWIADTRPDIYNTIRWLRNKTQGQPVILEAPGDSYTNFNIISAYTGLPTVSGWFVHEWLWRGDSAHPQKRSNEISTIYTSGSVQATTSLLQKYDVKYVIVGDLEREKYTNINETKLVDIAEKIYPFGQLKIYQIN